MFWDWCNSQCDLPYWLLPCETSLQLTCIAVRTEGDRHDLCTPTNWPCKSIENRTRMYPCLNKLTCCIPNMNGSRGSANNVALPTQNRSWLESVDNWIKWTHAYKFIYGGLATSHATCVVWRPFIWVGDSTKEYTFEFYSFYSSGIAQSFWQWAIIVGGWLDIWSISDLKLPHV